MSEHTFIAITGHGLIRAAETGAGKWAVDVLLADQRVHCLAADPHNPNGLRRDTRERRTALGRMAARPGSPPGLPVTSSSLSPSAPANPARSTPGRNQHWSSSRAMAARGGKNSAAFRRIFSRRFWFSPAEPPFIAYVQGIALSPTDPTGDRGRDRGGRSGSKRGRRQNLAGSPQRRAA